MVAYGALHHHGQNIGGDGFRHEIVGARTNRRNRQIEAAECRHHHDRQVGSVRCYPLAQFDPVHAGHLQIAQYDVERRYLESPQRRFGRGLPRRFKTPLAQRERKRLAHTLIVIHNQDSPRHLAPWVGRRKSNFPCQLHL